MRIGLTTLLVLLAARCGWAQDSSLLHVPTGPAIVADPAMAPDATLQNCSFMYQPLPPEAAFRELKKGSIVTVLVDVRSQMQSQGDANRRKQLLLRSVLTDWIAFDGKNIKKAAQAAGDPSIGGTKNSQFRANSELELQDSLTFRIAATIVDIRPNGNLVIEGHRQVEASGERWMTSVTGEVPRQAIGLDRTVHSDMIAGLKIDKYEVGEVRNGYDPGWFGKWWGKYKAF